MTQPPQPPQIDAEKIKAAFGSIAEIGKRFAAARQQAAATPATAAAEQPGQVNAALPFPADQIVLPHQIQWNWLLPREYWVKATYWKETGSWNIEFGCNDTTQTADLASSDAKVIAEALLSAVNWEHVWRTHAGTFLANLTDKPDEDAPVVPLKKPAKRAPRKAVPKKDDQ